MKKLFILSIIAALAALFTASAVAQTYEDVSLTIPNTVAGTATNGIGQVINCSKQQNVSLALTTTGATNVLYRIGASLDRTNWETNRFLVAHAGGGTTLITNLNVGGIGYLRVDSLTVTGTIAATNSLVYAVKRGAP